MLWFLLGLALGVWLTRRYREAQIEMLDEQVTVLAAIIAEMDDEIDASEPREYLLPPYRPPLSPELWPED